MSCSRLWSLCWVGLPVLACDWMLKSHRISGLSFWTQHWRLPVTCLCHSLYMLFPPASNFPLEGVGWSQGLSCTVWGICGAVDPCHYWSGAECLWLVLLRFPGSAVSSNRRDFPVSVICYLLSCHGTSCASLSYKSLLNKPIDFIKEIQKLNSSVFFCELHLLVSRWWLESVFLSKSFDLFTFTYRFIQKHWLIPEQNKWLSFELFSKLMCSTTLIYLGRTTKQLTVIKSESY